MKRVTFLAICALLSIGITLLSSCSNPLETTDDSNLNPPGPITIYDTLFYTDTIYVIDTIHDSDTTIVIDTIIVIDTTIAVDTIIVTDTITYIDTVIITEPGDGESQTICSILLSNLYEIIWMFHNQEGQYTLKFTAEAVRDFTFRTLTVDIDGTQFTWCPAEDPEIVREQYLGAYATIRIMTDQPCLQGHEVKICLTISKP